MSQEEHKSNTEDFFALVSALESTDVYKAKIKPYKQAIAQGDDAVIRLATDVVVKVISDRKTYKPMFHLNVNLLL